MDIKLIIFLGIVFLGILSGESSLQSAYSAKPPIGWSDLPLTFGGTAIAMSFVVGLQTLRSNPKFGRWAIIFMSGCTAYFLSVGLSAAFIADSFSPASLLFVSMGSGAFSGLLISWCLYRVRHLKK